MKGDKNVLRMAGKKLWDTNAWRRACTLRAAALAGGLGFIVFWRVCMCSFFHFLSILIFLFSIQN